MKTCKKQLHQYEASLKQCPECEAIFNKIYYQANKAEKIAKQNEYYKQRIATDPFFKFKCNVRNLIYCSIRNQGYSKNTKTAAILGCTFEQLEAHLIQTAIKNYGFYLYDEKYEIDHKTPLATATNEQETLALSHYSNLQYLYPHHNLAKSDKLDWTLYA